MKISTIREMRNDELAEKLQSLQKTLFSMRSQSRTEKVENVRAMKNTKRDIARIKTVIRQNELEAK